MTPKKTMIEQHRIDAATGRAPIRTRIAQAAARWLLGEDVVNRWQGPGQVLTPVAQEESGRLFDYPAQINTTATPRSTEMIGFAALRALADNYDLMRLVIERRKDQIEKLRWKFTTDNPGDDDKEDQRVKELTAFFQRPDKVNRWGPWVRMVVEEMLVIDALTLYPRKTNGGQLYSLDVMDGATIKPLTDNTGRRPLAPLPAYQQYIKGSPMAFYTSEELIYAPRNPRSNKFYGFSPVEQVIMTVNIALRRQIHQLHYYTEGNVPEGFVPVPESWTPKQVREFQRIWDSEMIGNDGAKRKVKFIPNVKNVIWTREPTLKDAMDEWLGRLICFAFSYPPSALTAQVNRATAETAQEVGEDEGLAPLMQAVMNVVNDVVVTYFGYEDIKFTWDTDTTLDPKTQADIDAVDAESGVRTIDEIREQRGLRPYGIKGMTDVPAFMRGPTPKEQAEADREDARMQADRDAAAQGKEVPPGKAGAADDAARGKGAGGKGGPGAQAAAGGTSPVKKAADVGEVDAEGYAYQERDVIKQAEVELSAVIYVALQEAANSVADAYAAKFEKMEKAKRDPLTQFIDNLLIELKGVAKVFKASLGTVGEDGVKHALGKVNVDDASIFALANKRARKYAEQRAGELITKAAGKGKLAESTRAMIRAYVADAAERGATNEEVAKHLREHYAFSQKRAAAIASYELRKADVEGNRAGWIESGVVIGKRWLVANEDDVCPVCMGNAEQGVVKLEEPFESGDMGAPAHPKCRCDNAPVLEE